MTTKQAGREQTHRDWREWDLRSKLGDGLLAWVVLYLLSAMLVLLRGPFQQVIGLPGLLVYGLTLLALAIYCLDHSLNRFTSQTRRAWYGMTGGILAWMVIETSESIGAMQATSIGGALTYLLVGLIAAAVWRHGLHLGARYFALTLLLNWGGHILIAGLRWLAAIEPAFVLALPITGLVALLGLVASIFWLFARTEWRVQRLWCAMWMWFFLTMALLAWRGSII